LTRKSVVWWCGMQDAHETIDAESFATWGIDYLKARVPAY
jgi:hypothetical protein